jgi:hypothetical protein
LLEDFRPVEDSLCCLDGEEGSEESLMSFCRSEAPLLSLVLPRELLSVLEDDPSFVFPMFSRWSKFKSSPILSSPAAFFSWRGPLDAFDFPWAWRDLLRESSFFGVKDVSSGARIPTLSFGVARVGDRFEDDDGLE